MPYKISSSFICLCALLILEAHAAELSDSLQTKVAVTTDSLAARIGRLRQEFALVKGQMDSLDVWMSHRGMVPLPNACDTIKPSCSSLSLRQAISSVKDTVLVVTSSIADEMFGKMFDKGEDRSRRERKRGFGGAGGVTPSFYSLNFAPVHEFCEKDPTLRSLDMGSQVPNGYSLMSMMGGMGYGGVGNGMRIGGGGIGGEKRFSVTKSYGAGIDTTFTLITNVGWGYLLMERAFAQENSTAYVGCQFGAGALSALLVKNTGGAFTDPIDDLDENKNAAVAPFALAELHGGYTYSLVSWLHVGADLSMPVFIATEGFHNTSWKSLSNGFYTVNPGVSLRLVFGNLG